MTVTPGDLAAIPYEHRKTLARWLLQRGQGFQPSIFLSAREAGCIRDTFTGAAVDVADPLSEDSTIGHAAHVLGTLEE